MKVYQVSLILSLNFPLRNSTYMKIKLAGLIIKFLNRELQMDSTEAPIQTMNQNFQLLLKNDEFTEEEVDLLYDLFNKLSNSVVKDGFIQKVPC
ncbi:uncharacterized protein LOC110711777 isoform X2 [Chenopodium quinoa]|uniref:uncharacterized protein LOC110711777 isoform X2 n=1 Tax=Chenopodium quinoa TaxID=63459 RepID=UPI000B788E89|nr:uncharacterized protein LOC110711777 isoform X2 [Chenopodium quinoa]